MTEPEDIRGEVEASVRLADEERKRLTGKVQDDRLNDAKPERDRTANRIRGDRLDDDNETTRVDRLAQSILLQENLRKLILALLAASVFLGCGLVFIFDYMQETRQQIDRSKDATESLNESFHLFTDKNEEFLNNHARTQRLICNWYRENDRPLPDNGDCEHR